MSPWEDILEKGHVLCTDNWYTSINLAEKLLDADTHLVRTLWQNRHGILQEVKLKKLKRCELIARENKNGITVLK